MRHLAWLQATPEGATNSRLKSFAALDENSSFLEMPNVDGADYLISLLNEAGLFESNGMGAVPLSWTELHSWLRCTELSLSNWEILSLKQMSEAYVGELNQADKKDRPAPYTPEIEEDTLDRVAVAKRLRNALQSFKRNTPAD
jgi:hypothetical protein